MKRPKITTRKADVRRWARLAEDEVIAAGLTPPTFPLKPTVAALYDFRGECQRLLEQHRSQKPQV